MYDLRDERDDLLRAVHGSSADEAPPSRVFPDHINVDLAEFRRTSDRFWDPDRPNISHLYRTEVNAEGVSFYTRRFRQWLRDLPEGPEIRPDTSPEPSPEPSSETRPSSSTRPRAEFAPASRLSIPPAPGPGTNLSIPGPGAQHPNPLAQHPVQLEQSNLQLEVFSQSEQVHPEHEVPPQLELVHPQLERAHFQPSIPQRRSSLYFNPQPASPVPQLNHLDNQFDDLFSKLEQIQDNKTEASEGRHSRKSRETQENGSVQSQAKSDAKMQNLNCPANNRRTVHFGSMLNHMSEHLPVGNPQQKDHSQGAVDAADEERGKRPRSLFGSVRKRRSMAGTPAQDINDGRRSSASVILKDMGKSSKEFFSKLTAKKENEEYRLAVAFVGDRHCGKSTLLSRYTLAGYWQPDVTSYRVQHTGPVSVEGFIARADIYDIAHQNVLSGQKHPLSITDYVVAVLCVDVTDQRNLESVAKWQLEIQKYCPGVPSIILGLKTDLRPNFPTLRLGFLNESIASTVGQGEEAARKNNAAAYYECSAKTGEGVTEFFESLARYSVQTIRNRNKLRQKASRKFSGLFRRE
ncbi:hypothetical protein diail_2543 [Diaporthe ilicicola]|nr:hypothetical protein diail_2543 [Diaporthe ilicicola]